MKTSSPIKVLNLYSGIGGNRKLWTNVDVTAVEYASSIANCYQHFFPDDTVIVGDAHQYLLDNYHEFDFIWSSPPCPTHSRMRNLMNNCDERVKKYPDMSLYQEIIFLKHFFKGFFVVENVISYYDPLIPPFESENHYFWSNFNISKRPPINRGIRSQSHTTDHNKFGFNVNDFKISNSLKIKTLNNLVNPYLGLHVFNCAFKEKQVTLL